MKTTDGCDLEKGQFYFTVEGQVVILNDFVTMSGGRTYFTVRPFYEGESMEVSGAGGSHHEIIAPYEHEGEERLVTSLFKHEPVEKLGEKYKAKMREIENLSLSVGLLLRENTNIKNDINTKKYQFEKDKREFDSASEKIAILRDELFKVRKLVDDKRQELSELEDAVSVPDGAVLSSEEIKRLRKRDFKLTCMENGGVDNWEWFDESLNEYRERYPNG